MPPTTHSCVRFKRIAIITEAASAGISLHSDKALGDGPHNRPRVMIPIEVPWSADKTPGPLGDYRPL